MRRVVLISICLILFGSLTLRAQNKPDTEAKAYKFAEFGSITGSEMTAKMKAFFEKLKTGGNLKDYIINYGTPVGIRARKKLIINGLDDHWYRCDYDCPRITIVDGPVEKRGWTVMWIIPAMAPLPTP